jgi:hypothetical protein
MTFKKLTTKLLAGVLALSTIAGLASCSILEQYIPGLKPQDSSTTSEAPVEKKSYQLTGEFKENLAALGNGFDFMLNLNEDGTAVLARYNPFNYDASDAATNRNYNAEYMKGTWKEVQKDGVDCLQIKLAVYKEDGTTTNDITAYAYDVAGVYSFELNFPLVVGMSFTRKTTLSGGEGKTYADDNAFIQAKKLTFEEPASVAKFLSQDAEGKPTGGTVYVQEDGTVLMYSGYTEFAQGTYAKADGSFSVTVGETVVEATIEDKKASFAYTYSMGGGYDVVYNFVCQDYTVIPNKGAVAPSEVKYTGSYNGATYSITVTSETECKYANEAYVAMGLSGFECTYTKNQHGQLILTAKEEPTNEYLQGIWAKMKDLKWVLNEADKTMNIKYVGTSGDITCSIVILSDTECKYANEAYASYGLAFECTYTVAENGVITLTVKEEPTNPMLTGIWTNIKGLSWTLNTTNSTMTITAA